MSTPAAPSGAGSAPPPPPADLETLEETDIDATARSVPPPAAMRQSQPELGPDGRSSAPNLDAIAKRARAKLALKIPDDAVPAAKSTPPPPAVVKSVPPPAVAKSVPPPAVAKSVPPPPAVAKSVPPPPITPASVPPPPAIATQAAPPAATPSKPPPPTSSGGALVNAIQAMRIISVGDSSPGDRAASLGHDAPYTPPTVTARASSPPPRPVSSPPRPVSTPPRPRSVPPRAVSQPPQASAPAEPIAPPPPAMPAFDLPPDTPSEPPPPAAESVDAAPAPPPPPAEPVSLAAVDVLSEEDVAPAPDSSPTSEPSPVPIAERATPREGRFDADDGIDVDVDQDGDAPGDRISDAPELDPSDVELAEPAARPAAPAPPPVKSAAPAVASVPVEPPTRKRGRAWWEDLFGDDFLRTMEKLSPVQVIREVSFIEESLGVDQGGVVLDLACGVGHHAVELASRGYSVVGYDLSLAMLARAADEAQDRDQKLNFLHGDMREMGFDEMFDGVYCWSTSFGFFDEEKNALVAERVHRALRRGGRFLLDVANRDYVAARQPSLVWFEGDGCVCMDEMSVDFITSRLRVKRTVMLDDGRTREIDYSIRLYSLHELGKLLHGAGFKIAEVSGQPATPGVFFGADSPRLIILAEKA